MNAWHGPLTRKPWVAHLMRAFGRFFTRLGFQFAGAVTYFSILALVPTLMVAFSVIGFVLLEVRPELIDDLVTAFTEAIGSTEGSTRARLVAQVEKALRNYTAIGVVGLLSAVYSGAGWMGNLRLAVQAQWRPRFDRPEPQPHFVLTTLLDLALLLGMLLGVVITFGLAAVSTSLADAIVSWLGLADVGWLEPLLRLVPVAFSIGAGWLLFVYLYTVLPNTRMPGPLVRRGAVIGAVGLAVLQYLASFLVGVFSRSPGAAIFGPAITLMVFLNLFATLILLVAAWIVTDDAVYTPPRADNLPETSPLPVKLAPPLPAEAVQMAPVVPAEAAVRLARLGLGTGYVTGAATGVGLGALVAWALGKIRPKRDG
jgi:membrane protein